MADSTTTPSGGNSSYYGSLSLVGSVGSVLSSALAASYQNKILKLNYEHESRMAQIGKMYSDWQYTEAIKAGHNEAARLGLEQKALAGKQRVAIGGSGVDINSGDSLQLQESSRAMYEADRRQILQNAINQAFGYRMQGNQYQAKANMANINAQFTRPNVSAALSLLQGVGTVAGKWYNLSGYDQTPKNETLDLDGIYWSGRGDAYAPSHA